MPMPPLPILPGAPEQKPVSPVRALMEPDTPSGSAPPRPSQWAPARPTQSAPPRKPSGGMPALPTPWKSASRPSAAAVQKRYVDTRLKELEATNGRKMARAMEVIERYLLEKIPEKKRPRHIKELELRRVYQQIQTNLQSAELTCNFNAETWFTNENKYNSYTQMYQRAVQKVGGEDVMVLKDTPQNQADTRAGVDNNITFPKSWNEKKVRIAERGRASPDFGDPRRIKAQMDTGKLTDVRSNPKDLAAWTADNPNFNVDTKQVFFALNYGRRPHGSAANYGYSYFVPKADLKGRCLYYSRDTFHSGTKLNAINPSAPLINDQVDADLQVAFAELGAILGSDADQEKAVEIQKAILESCYEGRALEDLAYLGGYAGVLLEAHHFGSVDFSKDVDYMVISPMKISDRKLWPQIVTNAKKFTQHNGIRLFQTS